MGRNSLCNATTLKINPRLNTSTTTGSTFNPGDSSVYNRNIVLLLPPAPALLVDVGRAFAALSARSAAALRRMAVFAPPGGEMDLALVTEPAVLGGEEGGEEGEDC